MNIPDCLPSYEPVDPPEIRVPDETFTTVEFYVHLGDGRPDIKLFEIILDYLSQRSVRPVMHLTISCHRATPDEPDMMIGTLFLGEPIDMG